MIEIRKEIQCMKIDIISGMKLFCHHNLPPSVYNQSPSDFTIVINKQAR
jgi:hypothetical protein